MGQHFNQRSGMLPVTMPVDRDDVEQPCPTCERAGEPGRLRIVAPRGQLGGIAPVTCDRGHMVLVQWRRVAE